MGYDPTEELLQRIALQQALELLTPLQREALELRAQNYTVRTIARKLKISIAEAQTALDSALHILRKELGTEASAGEAAE